MKILLTLLFSFFLITKAYSEDIYNCERFYIDPQGWHSIKGAEGCYRKNITIRINEDTEKAFLGKYRSNIKFKSDGKRMDLKFEIQTRSRKYYMNIYFLPNSEVHLQLSPVAGIVDLGGAKYKCANWPK